jgi:enoyl-CoA hydratase/carnithine racemase
VLATDLVIGSPNAKFRFPEVPISHAATGGITVRLIQMAGLLRAKCQDLQAEHKNMRFKLIVLMIIPSWMWDLPIDLYPGAPPS